MRSRNGNEKPWKVGETRTVKGKLIECEWGYHYSPDWESAIKGRFLYGPMACIVRVDDANLCGFKGVTATRTLVEAYDVTSAMRAFAADEAERALMAERKAGREPDPRSWAGMKAAWGAANGTVTLQELSAARSAAESAARSAQAKRFNTRLGDATGWWPV